MLGIMSNSQEVDGGLPIIKNMNAKVEKLLGSELKIAYLNIYAESGNNNLKRRGRKAKRSLYVPLHSLFEFSLLVREVVSENE